VAASRSCTTRFAAFAHPSYPSKLHFAPGVCAQVDWGVFGTLPVGNTCRRLLFFVIVLAYCRLMYVEFTISQTMEHFLSCLGHAFAAFGGVAAKIMVNNLT
jgi:transposase